MVSVESLKKEVVAIREALNVNVDDKTVIMSINGKDYTSKNLCECLDQLIEFSRGFNP